MIAFDIRACRYAKLNEGDFAVILWVALEKFAKGGHTLENPLGVIEAIDAKEDVRCADRFGKNTVLVAVFKLSQMLGDILEVHPQRKNAYLGNAIAKKDI